MTAKLKFGSLFSGVGGFDLGFERAGMTCAWQSEIDPKASEVLKRHWPNVPNMGDVKNVRRDAVEPVDVICGGFPCQDLSVAGKRAGLAGERSGLWFEFARVIDELEPRFVIVENVPGLLSSNRGADFAIILRWLVKRGYGVAWRVLDAQYFGVAQRRRRVFIVGSLGDGRAAEILFECEGGAGDTQPERTAGKAAPTLFASGAGTDRTASAGSEAEFCIPVAPALTGSGRGVERTGESRGQDPLVAYSIASNAIGRQPENGPQRGDWSVNVVHTLDTQSQPPAVTVMARGQANAEILEGQSRTLSLNHEAPIAFEPTMWTVRGGGGEGGKGYLGSEEKSFALSGQPQYMGVRRLTPVECERLQGFPDGWTEGQADSARYRQMGNAVAVPVVKWIGRRIMEAA